MPAVTAADQQPCQAIYGHLLIESRADDHNACPASGRAQFPRGHKNSGRHALPCGSVRGAGAAARGGQCVAGSRTARYVRYGSRAPRRPAIAMRRPRRCVNIFLQDTLRVPLRRARPEARGGGSAHVTSRPASTVACINIFTCAFDQRGFQNA